MDKLQEDRCMVCATFAEPAELEVVYLDLIESGVPYGDVSVLLTEEAFAAVPREIASTGLLSRLALVQGGFTGGIRVRAIGPASSFGVSGSVVTGLITTGIDVTEAAWLMHELADGRGLILVHAWDVRDYERAVRVFDDHGASRHDRVEEVGVAARREVGFSTGAASVARRHGRPPTHLE